jgi:CRISPR-associated protein Cas4
MTESDESHLPISGLQHLAFTPRQWGLIHLEQVWKENRLTAEGRLLHERADLPGRSRRDQVRTVRGMWLRSDRLALTGRADVVEFKPEPYPVEYKRGKRKPNDCDAVQLCAQALCLEEMLEVSISKGASSMAILGDVWKSSSLLSCVAEPSPSPQPCTNSFAPASPRLRNPVCTAVIARSLILAYQFRSMGLPTRENGWIGRSAAYLPAKRSATIRSESKLMRKLLNTVHVTTQGAYVHRDGETISVKVDNEVRLRLPIHTIESLVCCGQVTCSPFVLGLCCERGVGVSWLTENGRFLARVTGPVSGNVLLRRQQFRTADTPTAALTIVSAIVAAKIANSRLVLLRSARETR